MIFNSRKNGGGEVVAVNATNKGLPLLLSDIATVQSEDNGNVRIILESDNNLNITLTDNDMVYREIISDNELSPFLMILSKADFFNNYEAVPND